MITRPPREVAQRIDAKFLVAFTHSGDSARRLSRLRSPIPMLAFTPIEQTRDPLTLTWGVESLLVPMVGHTDDMTAQVGDLSYNPRVPPYYTPVSAGSRPD